MKKIIFSVIAATLLLASCNDNKDASLRSQLMNDSLQSIIDARDSEINELMGTFNEIEDGLRAISQAENRVSVARAGEGANRAETIRENMQFIQNTMKENKEKIARLEEQLKKARFNGDQLQKTIANLQNQLEEKERLVAQLQEELNQKTEQIAQMGEEITTLNTNVENLTTENEQKTQTIDTQDKQLHTAYYAFGTKKELKAQHIYEDGKLLRNNFNSNYFTKIDIRNTTTLKLYSKSARLLTAHPASSYTLSQDADKQYVLHITDPQTFWSASKYLVVQVK